MDKQLIVLEGLDGCGKSTQYDKISQYFSERNIKFKPISFPDYEQPSSALVKMYLNGEFSKSADGVNAYAASSFYAVDRYASYKRFWEDDYRSGTLILAARYSTSNCIYQLAKLDRSLWQEYIDWMQDYEYVKLGLPKPDLVIFLDMPIEVSQKLMSNRYDGDEGKKDIHESDILFLRKCREAALYSAEKMDWKIVECSFDGKPLPIDEITEKILDLIRN